MSYVSNHVHIVFSTTNRMKLIGESFQPQLSAYMAGIAKNHGMHAVAIGGIEDHVHALINLGATLGIAKAVQVLKANSSRWMNEHPGMRFEWQEGYFGCSVSRSQVTTVARYIAGQREHHRKMNSEQEFDLLFEEARLRPVGVPSPKGLGEFLDMLPGTAVPGYRLLRSFGTE